MRLELKNKRGITLIALVVTIIVLIILAGVSISLVLGDNGIVTRAKQAKSMHLREAVREKVELILEEYVTEKVLEEKDLDIFLNQQQEKGKIEEVEDNGDDTHTVILDGYEVTIRDDNLEIIIIIEESEFRKLTRGKAKFVYTPETKYVKSVTVSIEIEESVKMYTVQYKIGKGEGANWSNYTEGENFEVTSSGIIYGRFINPETNEKGYHFIVNIDNIDDKVPQKASIEFDTSKVKVNEIIHATVKQEDRESGINITNCKYLVTNTQEEVGIESTQWNTAQNFSENPQTIDITQSNTGTYYMHVLSCDTAGNKVETISSEIKFTGLTYFLRTSYFGRDEFMQDWKRIRKSSF